MEHRLNASYKFLGSKGVGNLDNNKDAGFSITIPRGNRNWNHIAYQYNYTTKTLRLYLNGTLLRNYNNCTQLSTSPYAWIGYSAYGTADPAANMGIAGVRIKYKALFNNNFSISSRKDLGYPYKSNVYNNIKLVNEE